MQALLGIPQQQAAAGAAAGSRRHRSCSSRLAGAALALGRPCAQAAHHHQQQLQHQQALLGVQPLRHQHRSRSGCSHVCRATVDDPEIQELVVKLDKMTPAPPAQRPQLEKAFALIDAANAEDPTRITVDGEPVPYRLAYSRWLTEWALKLDPKAPDELLLLARGRSIQSWKLADIKRDDYAPNTPGQRQWEMDRKKWLADRLVGVVKEAGFSEDVQNLINEVMLGKGIPDPRDLRKYDLVGAFGLIDYKTLKAVMILQTLEDAEALVFLDKNFEELLNRLPADEAAAACKRQLSRLSQRGIVAVLKQKWSPVQQRLLQGVMPVPFKFNSIMMSMEGVAAASTHPGDWRFADYDYE